MRSSTTSFDYLLLDLPALMWSRRRVIYLAILFASCIAFATYVVVGERYEAYTLLRVGQGIKDRTSGTVQGPFGEGVDLIGRIDSLARIGTTDHVIRQAALKVGFDRIIDGAETTLLSKIKKSVSQYEPLNAALNLISPPAKADTGRDEQQAIAALRDLISAKQEGRSELLRISFRYPEPELASEFLNELAISLVAAQAGLIQAPGADVFFEQQAKRLEGEAERAAADLQTFSVTASIYSVADQRALLLKRQSELTSLLSTTRGSIEEKKGQRQAIVAQLQVLRPVTQSRTVSAIVGDLGGTAVKKAPLTSDGADETPPILLVRVYQDAMASLLKVNSELSGVQNVEALINSEIEQANAELAALSSKEAEYDRLKRAMTRAATAAEHYSARMGEEQVASEIAKRTQLSSVRVVQLAAPPLLPMAPRPLHLMLLAVLGGLSLGAIIIATLELLSRRSEQADDALPIDYKRFRPPYDVQAAE